MPWVEMRLEGDLCRGKGRTNLELITDVQEQAVVVSWSSLLNHSLDSGITAKASQCLIRAIRSRRAELVQMGVDIIDVVESCQGNRQQLVYLPA